VALAVLYEVFGDRAFALDVPTLRAFSPAELKHLQTMLRQRLNTPTTTSAGRLFDAFASLLDLRQMASFEGQAAMELEFALAGAKEDNSYPYVIRGEADTLWLDWEPMVRAVLAEPAIDVATASARFHNTLVDMAAHVTTQIGERNVVLSGGCFQNRYLTERMVSRLLGAGYRPYWHQRVPPNDGGIALGQILAAQAASEARKD
jgi:hydrogenase maturation protein HypF